jgi:hypothetical protein
MWHVDKDRGAARSEVGKMNPTNQVGGSHFTYTPSAGLLSQQTQMTSFPSSGFKLPNGMIGLAILFPDFKNSKVPWNIYVWWVVSDWPLFAS